MKGTAVWLATFLGLIFGFYGCLGAMSNEEAARKADYHYRLARNYYNDRNIAMTQRELHIALSLDPNHVEAHHLKGFMLMGLKDYEGAAAEFKECLRLKPDHYEARNNLGAVYLAQGRYEEAIQVITPLISEPLYPTPALAHHNLGYAYYMLGDLSLARRHLEMALFLAPTMCKSAAILGQVYKDMKDFEMAKERLERAIQLCPNYAEPYYHLGLLLMMTNEEAKAREMFQKCAELAPGTTVGKRCQARR